MLLRLTSSSSGYWLFYFIIFSTTAAVFFWKLLKYLLILFGDMPVHPSIKTWSELAEGVAAVFCWSCLIWDKTTWDLLGPEEAIIDFLLERFSLFCFTWEVLKLLFFIGPGLEEVMVAVGTFELPLPPLLPFFFLFGAWTKLTYELLILTSATLLGLVPWAVVNLCRGATNWVCLRL